MSDDYKSRYEAALHEITVWQRECIGRQCDAEQIYNKLKLLCKMLKKNKMTHIGPARIVSVADIVDEVDGWPENAWEYFGYG